jgi:hypothetical protein
LGSSVVLVPQHSQSITLSLQLYHLPSIPFHILSHSHPPHSVHHHQFSCCHDAFPSGISHALASSSPVTRCPGLLRHSGVFRFSGVRPLSDRFQTLSDRCPSLSCDPGRFLRYFGRFRIVPAYPSLSRAFASSHGRHTVSQTFGTRHIACSCCHSYVWQ